MRTGELALVATAGLVAALVPVPASVAAAGTPAMTVSPTSYRTTFAWPHPSGQKATKTFVYTNHSGRALTLKLSIGTAYKGGPTGKGVWSLSRTQLKVPAHHHSSVTLTAYGTGAAAGDYKNHLVAAYGTAKLTTTIDATIAPQPKPSTFTLTVNAIDRTGAHVTPDLTLHQNLSNGSGGGCAGTVSGKSTQTFTVSPGSYNVFAPITSPDGTTTLADTDVTVSKDTTVTLDARQARQLQYAFDGPAAAPVRVQMGFVEPTWAPGPDWRDFCAIEQFGTDPSTYYMLAGPSQAQFLIRTLWQQPGATDVDPTPYYYDLVDTQAGLPANPTFTIHSADLSQVKTTYRNAGSGTSPVTVYTQPYPGGQDFSLAVSQTAPRTVTWYRTPGVKYLQGVKINGLTQTMPYTAYPAGPSTEIWNNALIAPEYEDFGSTAGVDDHGNIWYRGTEFLISPTPGIHSYPRSLPGFSSTLTKDGTAVPLTNSGFTT
ncbi:MAG: Subtilisin-like protein serine protease-like protein, partial [Gemmatimonadales bacterium]|nr:Subtilisin-like protein serine protease-like protein [Gemmatimonadales bacterium]